MISRRTTWLLALTLTMAVAVGWTVHRQHGRCATLLRPGAKRAPILGASGNSSIFGCRDVAGFATPAEKTLDVVAALSLLGLLRSILVDRHVRMQRR